MVENHLGCESKHVWEYLQMKVEETDHTRKSVMAFLYDIKFIEEKDAVLLAHTYLAEHCILHNYCTGRNCGIKCWPMLSYFKRDTECKLSNF